MHVTTQWRWHRGACPVELESDNVRLRSELEQARQVLAKADTAWSSLCVDREKLEQQCAGLRTAIDKLKEEKIQVLIDREAAVAAEQKKFRDYGIGHHKRLHELHVALEGALNEIGARCLSYPEKGSTIGEVVAWFEQEIRALPDAIAKANKNFLVYCLVGVLKMP
jgi:chromosome segregation ATPase